MGYVSESNEVKRVEAVQAFLHLRDVQKVESKQAKRIVAKLYCRHEKSVERWINRLARSLRTK